MDANQTDLVLSARCGDHDAFSRLVDLHWGRLVRLSRSVVGEVAAEDAAQDGLVLAWQKLGRLKDPEAFAPWVTRIVFRRCLRMARDVRFRGAALSGAEAGAPDSLDDAIWVEQVLDLLAPRQRAVLHLTVVEGMSDSEISTQLGIRSASVRAHRRRAKQSLEQVFKGKNNEKRHA